MAYDDFIKKTIEGLEGVEEDNPLIASRGFDITNKKDDESCVLIIGLNPAGNKGDAEWEKRKGTYFCSITGVSNNHWIYNNYFNPIYDFVRETLQIIGEMPKWQWCSIDLKDLVFDDGISEIERETIEKYYKEHKDNNVTIYIGDMFYFHKTASKDLPLRKDKRKERGKGFYKKYCEEMLKMHLEKLGNRDIKYVYVNNAQVSRWLSKEDKQASREFEYEVGGQTKKVKVFFGGMLSGQRAMDVFSRARLVQEIRSYLINA